MLTAGSAEAADHVKIGVVKVAAQWPELHRDAGATLDVSHILRQFAWFQA